MNFSFIAEHMMINISYMLTLIQIIEQCHNKPFWQAILDSIKDNDLSTSGFSEFETYGNFIACMYPQNFTTITRKRDRFAKQVIGSVPTNEQILWYGKYYDVCSIESWDFETPLAQWSKIPLVRCFSPKILRKLYKVFSKIKSLFYQPKSRIK